MEESCPKCETPMRIRTLWRGRKIAVCRSCGYRINNFKPTTEVKTPSTTVVNPQQTKVVSKPKTVRVSKINNSKLIKKSRRERIIARRKARKGGIKRWNIF